MGTLNKAVYTGLITAYTFILGTGVYGLVWEAKQPKQEIKKAKICYTERTNYLNDLHWSARGVHVYIDTGQGCWRLPIKFDRSRWDKAIKENDIVDLIIKPGFAPFGLEGKFVGVSVQRSE